MTRSTEFMAWGFVLTRLAELKLALAHPSGYDFQRVIGTRNGEPVHNVCAGNPKADKSTRGNQHAFGNKVKLLGDEPHGDGSVGLDRGAQITLDEFPVQVQGQWIDLAGIPKDFFRRVQHLIGKTDAKPREGEGENSGCELKFSGSHTSPHALMPCYGIGYHFFLPSSKRLGAGLIQLDIVALWYMLGRASRALTSNFTRRSLPWLPIRLFILLN